MIRFDYYNSRLGDLKFATVFIRSNTYKCYGPIQLVREIKTKKLFFVESDITKKLRDSSFELDFDRSNICFYDTGKTFLTDRVVSTDKYNLCFFSSSEKLVSFLNNYPSVKHVSRDDFELVDTEHYRVLVL